VHSRASVGVGACIGNEASARKESRVPLWTLVSQRRWMSHEGYTRRTQNGGL